MIFPVSSARNRMSFASHPEPTIGGRFRLACTTLGFSLMFSLSTGPGFAATLEMGIEGDSLRQRVETAAPASQPAAGTWNPLNPKLGTPGTPAGAGGLVDSLLTNLQRKNPQIFQPVGKPLPKDSTTAEGFRRLLPGGTGGVEIKGVGGTAGVATADGPVEIAIYLTTFDPATMEVHLFDPDGSEVYFNARPLLYWDRPNDTANAPVLFKGVSDPDSMVRHARGDYTPRPNLKYTFEIKKGQRIVLKTLGKALPSSYIKAVSPAL